MSQQNSTTDILMSRREAAEYLGKICLTSLDRLPIKRTRIRRRVFFKKSVLNSFLEEHTQEKEAKK
jgi:hypothetical protein